MDAVDQFAIKSALRLLQAAGGVGLTKTALLNQMSLAAGAPLSDQQLEAAFSLIKSRQWIDYHFEPIWHRQRWTLTARGMTALEGM